jgi:hypothetical protein
MPESLVAPEDPGIQATPLTPSAACSCASWPVHAREAHTSANYKPTKALDYITAPSVTIATRPCVGL